MHGGLSEYRLASHLSGCLSLAGKKEGEADFFFLIAAHDASQSQKGVTLSPHDQTKRKGSCQTEGSSVETQGFMQNILRQKENTQWLSCVQWGERCTFSWLVTVLQ